MRRYREKGVALLLTAIFTICLIPVVGLAIDASYMYVVKAKLTAAADAAALAAARNLTVGLTMADQENAARSRAEAFFHANFPDGYMDTLSKSVTISVAETTSRIRTVHVNASTRAHTWFMGFLGFRHVDINTTSTASRRDVNLMLVLDRSGSMSAACTTMKNAAKQFIDGFANGRDRIGMVAYSTGYSMGYLPNRDFKTSSPTLAAQVDLITCTGGTNSVQAMKEAWDEIEAMNEPGALNIIVFFTDGQPTALPAVFPIKTATDTRYGYGNDGYSYTYNQYSIPPSTCKDSAGKIAGQVGWNPIPRRGIIVATGTAASTGNTGAIISSAVQSLTSPHLNPINSSVTTSDEYASGCRFLSNIYYARRDVAYIPNTDLYGNATNCCYMNPLSSDKFSSGAYAGKLRPDKPITIEKAASNALDNQANTIRSHSTLYPVIYSIGLASVDEVLLKRVANDPTGPSYNTSQQPGLYAYAPDQTQLARAFAVIQSEILRIAR
ncbi:MAG: VWA domain-containing protein [Bryobacteraceae bacterium]|nr:VWA domain-containing protein [Bryobacteraceae bacterium]